MSLAIPACPDGGDSQCNEPLERERLANETFAAFVEKEQLDQDQIDALVLDEIAPELQIVLDDQERFSPADHLLRTVTPGGMRDPIEVLAGCWGRVETEQPFENSDTAIVVAEALRIDLADDPGANIFAFTMSGVGGMPCTLDGRPIVTNSTQRITSMSDDRFTVEVDTAQAGGLNDDGSLSLHELGTVAATLTAESTRTVLFTVDGDFLITSEAGFNRDERTPGDVDLWVRFICIR